MKNLFYLLNKIHDGIIRATLGKFLDHIGITADWVTIIRIILIPFIWAAWVLGNALGAIVIFLLAAWMDALDGALARTSAKQSKKNAETDAIIAELEKSGKIDEAIKIRKKQELGKQLDPVADKLLIITVAFLVGLKYLGLRVLFLMTAMEIATVTLAKFFIEPILVDLIKNGIITKEEYQDYLGSKVFGKIKMILQVAGLFMLLLVNTSPTLANKITLLLIFLFGKEYGWSPIYMAQTLIILSLIFSLAAWHAHYVDFLKLKLRAQHKKNGSR